MTLLSMHRRLLATNGFGLALVFITYIAIHGFDEQLKSTMAWMAVAAVGIFLGNRFVIEIKGLHHEDSERRIDGSPLEVFMVNIVLWFPVTLLATSFLLVVGLDQPLPSAEWMMIAVGGYIGGDIEAICRLG